MDEQEKSKVVVKRPIGNTSYIKPDFKLVDGKMVYDRSFKSFEQEENEKIMGAYQKQYKNKSQEEVAKIREENKTRREEARRKKEEDARNTKMIADRLQKKETLPKKTVKSKSNTTSRQVKSVNLFDELKVDEENRDILLDIINYSLKEREIEILKDYYGTNYDGLNRKTNSREAKSNASTVLSKIKPKLKEALKIKNDKLKYRYYLLSFKNEVECIPQNIFKDIPKNVLKNAYKKLTVKEEDIAKKYFNPLKVEELTDEELIIFSNVIFPKLNVFVFNAKGIFAYFKAFSKDEQKVLKDVISLLSADDKVLVKKKFGSKLDGDDKKTLMKQEYIYFRDNIYSKVLKKYLELLKCQNKTEYYLSLIKGFSNLDIEKNCNVNDEIDKKILLDILERLNEIDKNILFTTKELANMTRGQLVTRRQLIYRYIEKAIVNLKKVYSNKNEYNILLDQVFDGNIIQKEKSVKKDQKDKINLTISFANYLEKVSLNILEDVINYALKEDEKEFIYTLFAGDYGKSVAIRLKNKVKRFDKINIKINSFINYIVDFEEEHEEFLNRLKDFPKDEDYNLYQIKDLKTFLDIPYDANLKFILKNSLDKEEKFLLQKRFGLTYEGFLARKIDSKEKYSLMIIKDKIIKQHKLLEDSNEQEEDKKLEIILSFKKEEKPHEKGYKYTSLIEYLCIKDEELEKFYKIMESIFNEDERTLLQNRFGPKYDGVSATKISREDNTKIFVNLIPRINTKLNSKNKSLREFLGLSKDDQNILDIALKTIPLNEIELLKKGFGSLYDGENS